MSLYQPAVTCFGSVGKVKTAGQKLIDAIPTTWNYQTFGPAGVPGVQIVLPRKYEGGSFDFYAEYSTTKLSRAITSRWFDLWTATIAINAICVGLGKAGKALVDGGLVVKVDRVYYPPIVPGSSNGSLVVDVA